MRTTSDEPKESPALRALTKLGRESVERPTPVELDRGLDALYARVAEGRARRGSVLRWSLAGATALVAAVVAVRALSISHPRAPAPEPPALAYEIEGGSLLEGGYLRESGNGGIKLRFSEGSKVVLSPGARGRLRSVATDGARVAVDQGTASFQVTPKPDQHWWVEVGPFSVAVKGTVFTVSWDPSSERFAVNLRQGRVVVGGPLTGGEIALRAGQRLTVDLPRAETLITEDKADDAVDEGLGAPRSSAGEPPALPPPPTADRPAEPNGGAAAAGRTASNRAVGKRLWADQVASGRWDSILEDVERAGVEATLEKASSEDLFALSAAARYRRRTDLARAALLAVRRRFPDAPRSLDAIFLLGRVEESREGGKGRAIEWYDEYAARAASGPYAAEALGRRMILTLELKGRAEARPLAEEYLRRFPAGSYAGSARALVSRPPSPAP